MRAWLGDIWDGDGTKHFIVACSRGALLEPRLDAKHLSETFAWGEGVTPAALQFGFALLVDVLGSLEQAEEFFEEYTRRVVAVLPNRWQLTQQEIVAELEAIQAQLNLPV